MCEEIVLDSCTSIVDYLHVEDFCAGVFSSIQSLSGIINLCSGKEYSVKSIIKLIQENISSTSIVTFDPTKDRDLLPTHVCGNSDKLKSVSWTPSIDLLDGLHDLILAEKVKYVVNKNYAE